MGYLYGKDGKERKSHLILHWVGMKDSVNFGGK